MSLISRTDQRMLDIRLQISYLKISSNNRTPMSFKLACNLITRETVWITVKDGITLELNPIEVCAEYREKYASDVKKVTI